MSIRKLLLCATLLALAGSAGAADDVAAVQFSGMIVSSTAAMPIKLAVFADCEDGRERILGTIDGNRYRIALPPGRVCNIIVGEQQWDGDPQTVFDAGTATALTMLVYPRQVAEPELARELYDMGQQDSAIRHALAQAPHEAGLLQRLAVEDGARSKRLAQIIGEKGWPTHSMVGAQATRGAWLVAQHAPPEQLKRWLPLMQDAAGRHEINLPNLATSIDRVLVNDRHKQRYGSQFQARPDGVMQAEPIEDIARLDARRYSMGMSSFGQYLAVMQAAPGQAGIPASQP